MMHQILIDSMVFAVRMHRQQALKHLEAIADGAMTRQPAGIPNHAAWTMGHLIMLQGVILPMVRGEAPVDPMTVADGKVYGHGSTPTDDPGIYRSRADLMKEYEANSKAIEGALAETTPEILEAPAPIARWVERWGTVGRTVAYMTMTHEAYHLGQLAVWRRALEAGGGNK
jgi:hypothetical protein